MRVCSREAQPHYWLMTTILLKYDISVKIWQLKSIRDSQPLGYIPLVQNLAGTNVIYMKQKHTKKPPKCIIRIWLLPFMSRWFHRAFLCCMAESFPGFPPSSTILITAALEIRFRVE